MTPHSRYVKGLLVLSILVMLFISFILIKNGYLKHQNKSDLMYRLEKVYNEVSPLIKNEKIISFISEDSTAVMLIKSNYIFAPILLDRSIGQKVTLVLRENQSRFSVDTLFKQDCILDKQIEGFSLKLYAKRND